jgi:cobalt-zinc-cadmium efflux system protein
MGEGHTHVHTQNEKLLWITLGLTASYMIVEVMGGFLTHSLALLSDAAHMFTDVAALGISIAAIRIGQRPADASRTFGYYRFEILAAAFNATILFLVAFYILYEAYQRFHEPPHIQSMGMLIVAVVGLIVNLIGFRLLQAGSEHSLNVKGAYLEVWSDMLGSVGVIIAAIIIRFTGIWWIDPLVAVAIGFWVVPRTWILLKQSLNILLEGVPEGLQLAQIEGALATVAGVLEVHDLHVWAITSGKVSLTAHLVIEPSTPDPNKVLLEVGELLEKQFSIVHSTIQVELENCQPGDPNCRFESKHEPH